MKKYLSLLLLVSVVGLTSCLKDDVNMDPDETPNVIEIFQEIPMPTTSPSGSVHPLYTVSFNVVPSVDYAVHVNYSGPDNAPEDIQVTLAVDPQAMTDYNDDQDAHFELMPANVYDVDTWTVTIPAGQKMATLNFQFFTDQFDLSKSYALPLKIVSVSSGTISGNYGTVLFGVVAKNKFDGRYMVSGTCVDANGLYKGDYPRTIDLQTVNSNTVRIYEVDWDYPNYIVVSIATGGGANTGIRPAFRFDETTGEILGITNSNNGATLTMGPGNTPYDFNTRGFTSEWTSGRWHVTESWEYLGERP
jgi:hypothetical protein